jgi:hypothetical protein
MSREKPSGECFSHVKVKSYFLVCGVLDAAVDGMAEMAANSTDAKRNILKRIDDNWTPSKQNWILRKHISFASSASYGVGSKRSVYMVTAISYKARKGSDNLV